MTIKKKNHYHTKLIEEYTLSMMVQAYNPSTQEAEQEDYSFRTTLGYIVRPGYKTSKQKGVYTAQAYGSESSSWAGGVAQWLGLCRARAILFHLPSI